jgi:hypothetical protein
VESEVPSIEKVGGGCDIESWHLQNFRPSLYRLRTERLIPMSKHWMYRSHAEDMGPISLVICRQQRVALPHYFNDCLGRETRYGPTDRSGSVLWIVTGALFLESSDSAHRYWALHKRLLCIDHVRYVWFGTIRGLSVECVWHIGRVSTAGYTSIRIAATLRYE